jgi:hypothetical protein
MGRRRPSSTSSSSFSWVTDEQLQDSTGKVEAAMRWVVAMDDGDEIGLFYSLPYSSSPCSRPWHGNKKGKSK